VRDHQDAVQVDGDLSVGVRGVLARQGPVSRRLDEDRAPDYDGLSFTRERTSALRESLRSWCTAHRIDHLDLWEPLRGHPDVLADGLHPTPEGHDMLHRYLMDVAL
jgi:lysophospholipase L1-like esterase